MTWELLKVLAILIPLLLVLNMVRIGVKIYRDTIEEDPDVTITKSDWGWGYTFTDPWGITIASIGYLTEKSARKAARQHRNDLARELEEATGL